jgi:hypothetical protein
MCGCFILTPGVMMDLSPRDFVNLSAGASTGTALGIVGPGVSRALTLARAQAGCTELHPAPYDGHQACGSAGGFDTGDRRCLAGRR